MIEIATCVAGSGGENVRSMSERLTWRGADVVVGTPQRVLAHWRNGSLDLKNLQSVVVDEVDTLSDEFYERDVATLLSGLNKASPPQVALVGAAKTAAVERFLTKSFLNLDAESLGSTSASAAEEAQQDTRGHTPKWMRGRDKVSPFAEGEQGESDE